MSATVVEVGMGSTGHGNKKFVVAFEFGKGVLAHIVTVGFVAVDEHHGVAQVFGVSEDGIVHPSLLRLHLPAAIGVD